MTRLWAVILPTFGIISCATAQEAPQETAPVVELSPLHQLIAENDAAMFAAFNSCDGDAFGAYLDEGLEFYHDDDGVLDGPGPLIEAVKTSICGNFTRHLIPSSLEVWPIPGYGAVQAGVHTFTNAGATEPHGQGRFLHIWREDDDGWRITRIVSYDHRAYEALVSGD